MGDTTFTVIDDGMPHAMPAAEGLERARRAQADGRPVALDADERTADLGVSAAERARQHSSLQAPDFSLPDLDGRVHSLSEHHGKKVFLVAYGSW